MNFLRSKRHHGAPAAEPTATIGSAPPEPPISESPATASGSGSPEPGTKDLYGPSSANQDAPSRVRLSERKASRARQSIAIAMEHIDENLKHLDNAAKILALTELLRRCTVRLTNLGVHVAGQSPPNQSEP